MKKDFHSQQEDSIINLEVHIITNKIANSVTDVHLKTEITTTFISVVSIRLMQVNRVKMGRIHHIIKIRINPLKSATRDKKFKIESSQ